MTIKVLIVDSCDVSFIDFGADYTLIRCSTKEVIPTALEIKPNLIILNQNEDGAALKAKFDTCEVLGDLPVLVLDDTTTTGRRNIINRIKALMRLCRLRGLSDRLCSLVI